MFRVTSFAKIHMEDKFISKRYNNVNKVRGNLKFLFGKYVK